MTREEAYKKFKKIDSNIKWSDFHFGYISLLMDIYDDFEEELLKARKKAYIDGSHDCHNAFMESWERK